MKLQEDNGRWVFDTESGRWTETSGSYVEWPKEVLLYEVMTGPFYQVAGIHILADETNSE